MQQPVSPNQILLSWADGQVPQSSDYDVLRQWELQDEARAAAFGINTANIDDHLEQRSRLFALAYPSFKEFCAAQMGLPAPLLEPFWNLWLPLAIQIAQQRSALGRPLIQGILGGQGTGKTTLAALLRIILDHLGYQAVSLSLDDLYKTYAERQHLKIQDPRLMWRGPPGTHDLELGLATLSQLRQLQPGVSVAIPRFDKSLWNGAGDRIKPENVSNVDIVLFEGWFVGVRPVNPDAFLTPLPPIVTKADQGFAQDCNDRLRQYLPLWNQLDRLIVLYLHDYRLSQQWRLQAEQQMRSSGKPGMTDAEIEQFVNYFWKALHPDLFLCALINNPGGADMVIEIQANHQPGRVFHPAHGAL
jgi:D-glycerate 3-kinase